MSQFISRCCLLPIVLAAATQISANNAVPVSDLVNDAPVQPRLVVNETVTITPSAISSTNNVNAQMFDLVEMLQVELQQLRGQVEELTYNLNRLKQDQKQRYLDLDRRIVSLSSQPVEESSVEANTVTTKVQSEGRISGQLATVQPKAEDEQQPVVYDAEAEKSAYKAAFGLIREREYEASIIALLALVNDFPQGALVGNAYYWLGEVYMVQGDATLAAQSFERVINDFSNHRKIPDALYKAGVAYQKIGDQDKAKQLLERVLNKYPDSSAARLAQERMN
ncbi:MAG: tol-pal system protein YbgF [Gammaproteobacteria bacterium]|nr:tol-pal system protein YbgF [Gammaproteobacteria bacterium]